MKNIRISERETKIPVREIMKNVLKYTAAIGEKAPMFMGKIVEVVTPAIKAVKNHPTEFLAGALSGAIVIDDLHQRRERKKEGMASEKHNTQVSETIRKQDAEIQTLKAEAKEAHKLKDLNKQLCNVFIELQEGGER